MEQKEKQPIKWEEIADYFLPTSRNKVKLDDVILIDNNAHIKPDIRAFIEEVKQADTLIEYNLGTTRSIFFGGAPGTGKTMLAKAMASELGYELHILDIGQILKDSNGLAALGKIFEYHRNRANQPVILFLDECDACLKSRENADVEESTKRITNLIMQVLNEENESKDSRLIVIAASNYATGLDEAAMTRFQLQETFELPTDYMPFIKMEIDKNKMFYLVDDVIETKKSIVNKNARLHRFSIRALNSKITWAMRKAVIERASKDSLDGQPIPIKLSDIFTGMNPEIYLSLDYNDGVKDTSGDRIDFGDNNTDNIVETIKPSQNTDNISNIIEEDN